MSQDKYETVLLDRLARMLDDDNAPKAKVGILGDKTNRGDGGPTNAEIGARHEFGTDGMKIRSFLRMPIALKMQKALEESGAFNEDMLKLLFAQKSLIGWVRKLAILGEGIVLDAFETGGFGYWPGLNPKTWARKKNKQILVETQQLRNSITSEVS